MARVSLEGVSKVFAGGVTAVSGLNLEVREREFLVLVGPSGCGKSTTLRLIAGLEQPTAGVVCIGGRNVGRTPARHRNIALVFQNQPLYPQYSVARNIEFGLKQRTAGDWLPSIWNRLAHLRTADGSAAKRNEGTTHTSMARMAAARVREAARGLGIEHLLDRLPRQLSGGERQRVALGRAIVRNPAVFLLDEPLANLDANLRIEFRRLIRQMHDESQAVTIHVTHDQAEALALADCLAVMDQGRIRQVGAPLDVYDHPQNRFVASFIGNPPMNLVEGRLIVSNEKWWMKASGLAIEMTASTELEQEILRKHSQQDVVCGLRAEHLEIVPAGSLAVDAEKCGLRVSLVEHLGDESWLHMTVDSAIPRDDHEARPTNAERLSQNTLVGKTITRTPLRPGEAVAVRCPAARAHWFDRRSGERLI